MIIADSDVLVDALRGADPARARVEAGLRERRLATTAITRFELLVGARTADEIERVRQLLGALVVLPFDRDAADRAANVGRELAARGDPLPMADLAIAGICLGLDAVLLTRNLKHFTRVPHLRAESP